MNYSIILAAGEGSRFGGLKQFEKLNNKEVFLYSLEKFVKSGKIDKILLVINSEKQEYIKKILERENIKDIPIITGGNTRFHSIMNGIKFIFENYNPNKDDNILIHDSVRPNFQISNIEKIIENLNKFDAVSLGYKITDSLKKVEKIESTILIKRDIDREKVWAVTTPQGYKIKLFESFLSKETKIKKLYDETSLFLKNSKIAIIEDTRYNIKITYKEDLEYLRKIIK